MTIETPEIIRSVIADLKPKLKVKSVVADGDYFKAFVCKSYYLAKGAIVVINSETYEVKDAKSNDYVILDKTIAVGEYELPAMYYKHGSILQTSAELQTVSSDMYAITPMAYLRRPIREDFQLGDSAIDRNADITIFFLTQANFNEWETEEHDSNAVVPMRNMAYAFIDLVNKKRDLFTEVKEFTLEDRIKFGVVSDLGVQDKAYFNIMLSGVQLDINLGIKKNENCNCK
jgi:hypothetical protein